MSGNFNPTQLSFFITPPHKCPYLTEKTSKTIFLSPEIASDNLLYTALINQGFRRSGEHIYRPNCESCSACLSVRIPVFEYKNTRSNRRILNKAKRFRYSVEPANFNQKHYLLFDRYISQRHQDGDMFPTSPRQFKDFLLCDWLEVNYLNIFDIKTGALIGTCVYDIVNDGFSAIYTFFDPDYEKFSIGKLAILKLMELVRQAKLPFLYLGYWIKGCQKMSYKGDFRPIEYFTQNHWVKIS